MTKAQAAYEKIESARKKTPEKTLSALFREHKIKPTDYYRGKRKLAKVDAVSVDNRYQKLVAKDTSETLRAVVIFGTPEQIREILQ